MWHITQISAALSMSQPEKFVPGNKSVSEPADSLPELRETGVDAESVTAHGLGYVVGRYRLERQVGEGGMSVVYKAFDVTLNRDVAVKRLHTTKLGAALARFQQEARAAAKLQSKHIVSIFDFGTEDDGTPYLVMEYIDGAPMSDLIKQGISWEIACKVTIQVCDALQQAHAAGVVHRDVKPGNILITISQKGEYFARVVDFGIARLEESAQSLTQTGEVFGSPLYMSPEQATGKRVDSRTDIYSLGCVLFEAVAGHPPFQGASSLETLMMHQTEPTPRIISSQIPSNLMDLIDEMLQKDPQQRPPNCANIADRLNSILNNPTNNAIAPPVSKAQKCASEKKGKSKKAIIIAAAILLCVGVASFALLKPPHVMSPPSQNLPSNRDSQSASTRATQVPDPEITELLDAVKARLHEADETGAIVSVKKALVRSKNFGTPLQRAEALQIYAVLLTSGEFAEEPAGLKEAEKASRESVKIVEDEGLTRGPAYVYHLMTLANVLNLEGQQRDAIALANRCQKIAEQSENPDGYQAGDIEHALGKYWSDFGDYGAAKKHFAKALKILEPIKIARKDCALIHSQLAQLLLAQKFENQALSEHNAALEIYKMIAIHKDAGYRMLSTAYSNKGRLLEKLAKNKDVSATEKKKMLDQSKLCLENGLRTADNALQSFVCLRELAKFARDEEDFEKAEDYYQKAFDLCDQFPARIADKRKLDIYHGMEKNYKAWGLDDKRKKVQFRIQNMTAGGAYN